MHKKFEINRTKIKSGCQSGRKEVPHDSKSDLPLMGIRIRADDLRLYLIGVSLHAVQSPLFTGPDQVLY